MGKAKRKAGDKRKAEEVEDETNAAEEEAERQVAENVTDEQGAVEDEEGKDEEELKAAVPPKDDELQRGLRYLQEHWAKEQDSIEFSVLEAFDAFHELASKVGDVVTVLAYILKYQLSISRLRPGGLIYLGDPRISARGLIITVLSSTSLAF